MEKVIKVTETGVFVGQENGSFVEVSRDNFTFEPEVGDVVKRYESGESFLYVKEGDVAPQATTEVVEEVVAADPVIETPVEEPVVAVEEPIVTPVSEPVGASSFTNNQKDLSGFFNEHPTAQLDAQASQSKIAAGLLAIFLGAWGIHNFYLGKKVRGFIQLGLTVLSIILVIVYMANVFAMVEMYGDVYEPAITGGFIVVTLLFFLAMFLLSAVGLWALIEGILILVSKPGSSWHKNGAGKELRD